MKRELITKLPELAITGVLALALFADQALAKPSGLCGSILRDISASFQDPHIQSLGILSFGIYVGLFSQIRRSTLGDCWRVPNSIILLIGALLLAMLRYWVDAEPSKDFLIFFASLVAAQLAAFWVAFSTIRQAHVDASRLPLFILSVLVLLFAMASLGITDSGQDFVYRGRRRWAGPWNNPNIFGLLMGVGFLIAIWSAKRTFEMRTLAKHQHVKRYALLLFYVSAAFLISRALFNSFSRGAWLATACGSAYLIISTHRNFEIRLKSRACHNLIFLTLAILSLLHLSYWQFRQIDLHPVRRAVSVIDAGDFSWRNRVAAWKGAFQIMADNAGCGVGWNQPKPMYDYYYLPTKLTEGEAIEMNDYLSLGARLGCPALFLLAMYLMLALAGKATGDCRSASTQTDAWTVACRSGAIVLLVGFWFDGGWFKLPTATTFFLLLELGAITSLKTNRNLQQAASS